MTAKWEEICNTADAGRVVTWDESSNTYNVPYTVLCSRNSAENKEHKVSTLYMTYSKTENTDI